MLDRFERPLKIVCVAMALLLVCQTGSLVWRGNPLAHVTIPPLPTLPEATNEVDKPAQKETATAMGKAANATNSTNGTNAVAKVSGGEPRANTPENMAGLPPGLTPDMMAALPPEVLAQMMGGGMPGGRGPAGMKKTPLPPEIQARVDRIISSELLGPVVHSMLAALIGISDNEAFIRATNGQTGPIKVGGEIGGIKLLRIGVNRVLVEQDGEKRELTLFGGAGGESLLPKAAAALSTNAPAKSTSTNHLAARPATTNLTLSSTQKETH
jgi:hypothetical protein